MSLPVVIAGLSSCESGGPLFDDEGDCSVKVQFVYNKHRQALHSINGIGHDAFSNSVSSVHLFIYDAESGDLVYEKKEKAANLKSAAELNIGSTTEKSFLPVDLNPGKYRLVAWCGLDDNDQNNAFELTGDDTKGKFKTMTVKKNSSSGHPVNSEKYEAVYHGKVESVEVTLNSGGQIIPVELTKDTNDIAVWVQHTTATFADGDYYVVYKDANGTVNFDDNSLADENLLEYHAHTTSLLTSDSEYNGSTVEAGALIAHISTSRLMQHRQDDARIEVRNKAGETVYSLPLIKYLTQMQTFTSDHQYYLDCEDTYNCTFYLTGEKEDPSTGAWVPMQIIINNWVIVPPQSGELSGN